MPKEALVVKRLAQLRKPEDTPVANLKPEEWRKAMLSLTEAFYTHVAPQMPERRRRGKKRNVLIVGGGGRLVFEVAGAALALGPATVTGTDIDHEYEAFGETMWGTLLDDLGHDFFGASTAEFPKAPNGTDIFTYKPAELQDVVIAMGVHPRDVVKSYRLGQEGKVNWGIDKIIEMAREDGGVVVFSKHSDGQDLIDLQEQLLRRQTEYNDIDILTNEPVDMVPDGPYMSDRKMLVVKRHKPNNQ